MALKKCDFCPNKVPEGGQCNKCGFIDGISKVPVDEDFKHARDVNDENEYAQFENLDMLMLD